LGIKYAKRTMIVWSNELSGRYHKVTEKEKPKKLKKAWEKICGQRVSNAYS